MVQGHKMIGSKAEYRHDHYFFSRHHSGDAPEKTQMPRPWLTIAAQVAGWMAGLYAVSQFILWCLNG